MTIFWPRASNKLTGRNLDASALLIPNRLGRLVIILDQLDRTEYLRKKRRRYNYLKIKSLVSILCCEIHCKTVVLNLTPWVVTYIIVT